MILDHLHYCDTYTSLGKRFAQGFAFLKRPDLATLPDGEYPIDQRNVFAIVQTLTTKPQSQGKFEAHRRYADIQYVISGNERMGITTIDGLTPEGPFDEAHDFVLFHPSPIGHYIDLHPGQFCIFFPHDAHMPGLIPAPAPITPITTTIGDTTASPSLLSTHSAPADAASATPSTIHKVVIKVALK